MPASATGSPSSTAWVCGRRPTTGSSSAWSTTARPRPWSAWRRSSRATRTSRWPQGSPTGSASTSATRAGRPAPAGSWHKQPCPSRRPPWGRHSGRTRPFGRDRLRERAAAARRGGLRADSVGVRGAHRRNSGLPAPSGRAVATRVTSGTPRHIGFCSPPPVYSRDEAQLKVARESPASHTSRSGWS